MVRAGSSRNGVRKHKGNERRAWKRIVSVMDATLHFLRALCGFDKQESVYQLLSFHSRSIEAIYEMSKVIIQVLYSRSTRSILAPDGGGISRTEFAQNRELYDEVFKLLMPTVGLHPKILYRATCAVQIHVFEEEVIKETESEEQDSNDRFASGEESGGNSARDGGALNGAQLDDSDEDLLDGFS